MHKENTLYMCDEIYVIIHKENIQYTYVRHNNNATIWTQRTCNTDHSRKDETRSCHETEIEILQRTATHCNALQHTATHCNTLQHTATHCNTLQHTATHCNNKYRVYEKMRLEVVMRRKSKSWIGPTAIHCNALQHTATHCNTLQRTTTLNIKSTKRWDSKLRICMTYNTDMRFTECLCILYYGVATVSRID